MYVSTYVYMYIILHTHTHILEIPLQSPTFGWLATVCMNFSRHTHTYKHKHIHMAEITLHSLSLGWLATLYMNISRSARRFSTNRFSNASVGFRRSLSADVRVKWANGWEYVPRANMLCVCGQYCYLQGVEPERASTFRPRRLVAIQNQRSVFGQMSLSLRGMNQMTVCEPACAEIYSVKSIGLYFWSKFWARRTS